MRGYPPSVGATVHVGAQCKGPQPLDGDIFEGLEGLDLEVDGQGVAAADKEMLLRPARSKHDPVAAVSSGIRRGRRVGYRGTNPGSPWAR